MYYISAMFDTVKMIDAYMSVDMWLECHRALTRVLEVLSLHAHLKLGPILIDDLATQAMANQGMNKGKESAALSEAAKSVAELTAASGEATAVVDDGEEVRDITQDENDPNMVSGCEKCWGKKFENLGKSWKILTTEKFWTLF